MTAKEISDMLVNQGGMTALAIFAIWMTNQVWKLYFKNAERYAEDIKTLQAATLQALQGVTTAITKLDDSIRHMQER